MIFVFRNDVNWFLKNMHVVLYYCSLRRLSINLVHILDSCAVAEICR